MAWLGFSCCLWSSTPRHLLQRQRTRHRTALQEFEQFPDASARHVAFTGRRIDSCNTVRLAADPRQAIVDVTARRTGQHHQREYREQPKQARNPLRGDVQR